MYLSLQYESYLTGSIIQVEFTVVNRTVNLLKSLVSNKLMSRSDVTLMDWHIIIQCEEEGVFFI